MNTESSLKDYFLLEMQTCIFLEGKDAGRDYVRNVTNQIVINRAPFGVIADGEVGRRFRDANDDERSDFLEELRYQLAQYRLSKELYRLIIREHSEDGLNVLDL